MNSRARVTKALNHQEPDKVPIDLGGFVTTIEVAAYEDLKNYLGIAENKEIFVTARAHVAPDKEILERFNIDTRYLWPRPTRSWKEVDAQDTIIDEWGVKWHRPKSSYYFDPVGFPLSGYTYEDLKDFSYPDLWDHGYENKLFKKAKNIYEESDYFLVGDPLSVGIFEQAWFLRGLENFFIDLASNKAFANKLLDIVLEQRKDFYGKFLDIVGPFVGMVMVSDDLGAQDNLLISPDMYREMIKPRHRELNEFIKEKADVKLFHHSCGAIREIIDDLIEIGIDVLNPVQVSASGMDSKELKEDFGDKIVFWGGGCDTQKVLQFSTPEEVYEETKKRINDFKPGGGFVFTQIHEIQPETPPQNIVAMYEAVEDNRVYRSF